MLLKPLILIVFSVTVANAMLFEKPTKLNDLKSLEILHLDKTLKRGNRTEYEFDDRGNPSKTTYADGSLIQENDDGTISNYTYNKKNELIQLTTATDTYQYQYDPHSVRNQAIINGQTTEYLIDHNQTYAQVLVETTATGQTIYTYGDDLLTQENTTGIHYYQYDGLGSTRQLTDNSQTITDSYNYDAYGVMLNQTGTTQNNYLYTGEQFDPNMGFYYLRARYMNPAIGRFTSMDTYAGSAGTPISLNKYVYANANPITYTDPSGFVSLAEFSAASRIRGILNNFTINIGFNFLDPANAEKNIRNNLILGAVAGGGAAAFKLFRMFSSKFRKASNSFAENTIISTEFGFKDIEEIQIGDKVWAFNEQENTVTLQEVVHTIVGQAEKQTIDITLASGEIIQATDEHPIYAQTHGLWDWVEAKNLKQDMLLMDRGGQTLSILNITHNSIEVQVFNLTVANGHTYYVTTDEVLVHNAGVCRFVSSIDMQHITRGDFVRGRFGGWHSRYLGNPSGRRIKKIVSQRNSQGIYEAKVQYRAKTGKWKRKANISTFYPDSWNPQKISSEIHSAYLAGISQGKSGVFIAKSASGVRIKIVTKRDGIDKVKIRTAFPIYE